MINQVMTGLIDERAGLGDGLQWMPNRIWFNYSSDKFYAGATDSALVDALSLLNRDVISSNLARDGIVHFL